MTVAEVKNFKIIIRTKFLNQGRITQQAQEAPASGGKFLEAANPAKVRFHQHDSSSPVG